MNNAVKGIQGLAEKAFQTGGKALAAVALTSTLAMAQTSAPSSPSNQVTTPLQSMSFMLPKDSKIGQVLASGQVSLFPYLQIAPGQYIVSIHDWKLLTLPEGATNDYLSRLIEDIVTNDSAFNSKKVYIGFNPKDIPALNGKITVPSGYSAQQFADTTSNSSGYIIISARPISTGEVERMQHRIETMTKWVDQTPYMVGGAAALGLGVGAVGVSMFRRKNRVSGNETKNKQVATPAQEESKNALTSCIKNLEITKSEIQFFWSNKVRQDLVTTFTTYSGQQITIAISPAGNMLLYRGEEVFGTDGTFGPNLENTPYVQKEIIFTALADIAQERSVGGAHDGDRPASDTTNQRRINSDDPDNGHERDRDRGDEGASEMNPAEALQYLQETYPESRKLLSVLEDTTTPLEQKKEALLKIMEHLIRPEAPSRDLDDVRDVFMPLWKDMENTLGITITPDEQKRIAHIENILALHQARDQGLAR